MKHAKVYRTNCFREKVYVENQIASELVNIQFRKTESISVWDRNGLVYRTRTHEIYWVSPWGYISTGLTCWKHLKTRSLLSKVLYPLSSVLKGTADMCPRGPCFLTLFLHGWPDSLWFLCSFRSQAMVASLGKNLSLSGGLNVLI